jgi:hypothetical protein
MGTLHFLTLSLLSIRILLHQHLARMRTEITGNPYVGESSVTTPWPSQTPRTPSTKISLAPDNYDVTGIIHESQRWNSGKLSRTVTLCVFFLNFLLFSLWRNSTRKTRHWHQHRTTNTPCNVNVSVLNPRPTEQFSVWDAFERGRKIPRAGFLTFSKQIVGSWLMVAEIKSRLKMAGVLRLAEIYRRCRSNYSLYHQGGF